MTSEKNGMNVGGVFLFVLIFNCYTPGVEFQHSFSHTENNFKAEEILCGALKNGTRWGKDISIKY